MKLKIWLDSGANIHSCKRTTIDLDELNITEEEWAEYSDKEKEEAIKPIAFETLDWGWEEID